MDPTKNYPKDLDSPRQELSNDGLKIVVAFLVLSGFVFCLFVLVGQSSINAMTILLVFKLERLKWTK